VNDTNHMKTAPVSTNSVSTNIKAVIPVRSSEEGHSSARTNERETRSAVASRLTPKKSSYVASTSTPNKFNVVASTSAPKQSNAVASSSATKETNTVAFTQGSNEIAGTSVPKKTSTFDSNSAPKSSSISTSTKFSVGTPNKKTAADSVCRKTADSAEVRPGPEVSATAVCNDEHTGKSKSIASLYKYDNLCDLIVGATANVFGVVKFFRPVTKSRGAG